MVLELTKPKEYTRAPEFNRAAQIYKDFHRGVFFPNILGIFAHADDAAIAAGGYLASAVEAGAHVKIIVLTDQGPRKDEEREANRRLGIPETYFLDFNDGNLDHELVPAAVGKMLDRFPFLKQAQELVGFDQAGYTSHPDHQTAYGIQDTLWHLLPKVQRTVHRVMSDEERRLWGKYFIPIQPQGDIRTRTFDSRWVAHTVADAITAHESQFAVDGRNHLLRRQILGHREEYRIDRRYPEVYGKKMYIDGIPREFGRPDNRHTTPTIHRVPYEAPDDELAIAKLRTQLEIEAKRPDRHSPLDTRVVIPPGTLPKSRKNVWATGRKS